MLDNAVHVFVVLFKASQLRSDMRFTKYLAISELFSFQHFWKVTWLALAKGTASPSSKSPSCCASGAVVFTNSCKYRTFDMGWQNVSAGWWVGSHLPASAGKWEHKLFYWLLRNVYKQRENTPQSWNWCRSLSVFISPHQFTFLFLSYLFCSSSFTFSSSLYRFLFFSHVLISSLCEFVVLCLAFHTLASQPALHLFLLTSLQYFLISQW